MIAAPIKANFISNSMSLVNMENVGVRPSFRNVRKRK
jgi:hypothetical protein